MLRLEVDASTELRRCQADVRLRCAHAREWETRRVVVLGSLQHANYDTDSVVSAELIHVVFFC